MSVVTPQRSSVPIALAANGSLAAWQEASIGSEAAGQRLVEVRASVGAGFVYPICGDMTTMPGLGSAPAASIIDFDEHGEIIGLS